MSEQPTNAAVPSAIVDGLNLECPGCHSFNNFRHIEQVWVTREIVGIEHGKLVINGHAQVDDWAGENEVLVCDSCGDEFKLPLDIDVEWQ